MSITTIGEALVKAGKLQPEELQQALSVNDQQADGIGPLLVRLGLVSEADLVNAYAEHYHLERLADHEIPVAPLNPDLFAGVFLEQAGVLPVSEERERITLAVTDPDDHFTVRAVELACGKAALLKLASISQMDNALRRLYGDDKSTMEDIVEAIPADAVATGEDSVAELRSLAAEAPIIRLVNLIINRAVSLRASDIHIEPFARRMSVRYRIDGLLQDAEAPPAHSGAAIISRIKIMARLNIAERRLPQDGRIQLRAQGRLLDLRVSTFPTLYGESMVLRILDQGQGNATLEQLGFNPAVAQGLRQLLTLPHGIILVTGPTGSGKTTTLYAALQRLNTDERKILTVEDPVEYQLEGINQMQVKPQIGLNFAAALRALVRQDPDVIMIGEMRDVETARIAVQAALTGHLVFSTLHTNDAGSSITRLLDMGIEDYLLTSTLSGILAQRLVRTLCHACRSAYAPDPALYAQLQQELPAADADNIPQNNEGHPDVPHLYQANGCDACAHTGYRGRTVIGELLLLSDTLRSLVRKGADGKVIQQAAIHAGMDSMRTDGIKKALAGMTTVEEITRVTQCSPG
ncbi:MAG: type II secretion system ATPase GspE [Gammaproteobacteria bacterium]|nr:type II secretion system ATPase GspE [Gammaproteobacteria bacterium]